MENNDSQHPRKHFRIMKEFPVCSWVKSRLFKSFSLKAKGKDPFEKNSSVVVVTPTQKHQMDFRR